MLDSHESELLNLSNYQNTNVQMNGAIFLLRTFDYVICSGPVVIKHFFILNSSKARIFLLVDLQDFFFQI